MTKPLDAAAATMRANLEASSGKSLEQWVAIATGSGKRRHGEIVAHLKDEGLTYGYASLVAHSFLKTDAKSRSETTDLVAEQYSGEKAGLKPIYDAIVKAAEKCGDLEIAPKEAMSACAARSSLRSSSLPPRRASISGSTSRAQRPRADSKLRAERRRELFAEHRANIERLADRGDLVLAAPLVDGSGKRGIFVINASSIDAAKEMVASDPAIAAGVFSVEYSTLYGSAALMQVTSIHKKLQRTAIE